MNGPAGFRGVRTIELRSVFSPLSLVAFLYVPILLLYVASGESVFASEFESRKTLSWTGFSYFALAVALFAAGAKAGDTATRRRETASLRGEPELSASSRRSLAVLLEASLIISIGAYVLWLALGAVRTGGPLQLFEIWRTDPHRLKGGLLITVPGVTTLTQLAVAALPLAFAYRFAGRGGVIRVLAFVLFMLAIVRSVLFQERLALIELVVPLIFLAAAPRKVTVPRVVLYGFAFLAAAVTLFAITELRRTYVYTRDFSPSTSAVRFFGYYLTSVNNGIAVVDNYPARTPLYSSGAMFWNLPVVGDLHADHLPGLGTVSLRYRDAFGIDPPDFWPGAFASQGLDYEFNVFSAPGYLAADFGWAGLVAVLVLGVVSGRLYRRSASSPFYRALYGVWLVGLLEFMRILYFTNTRVFPAYLVFLAAYVVLRQPVPGRRLIAGRQQRAPAAGAGRPGTATSQPSS